LAEFRVSWATEGLFLCKIVYRDIIKDLRFFANTAYIIETSSEVHSSDEVEFEKRTWCLLETNFHMHKINVSA
jgi:hypothetical protein